MIKPSKAFASTYSGAVGAVAVQLAREPAFSGRLTAAATAFAVAVAVGLTVAPPQAQAQNNVKRTAIDTFAGLAGAAIGGQFGGGRGKSVAAAAGAAAGVWIAESMQEDGRPQSSRFSGHNSNFGPSTDWGNVQVPGMSRAARQPAGATRLSSGVTPLSVERENKLVTLERTFLTARDTYAEALFNYQQAKDDAVLEPGNRHVASQVDKAASAGVDAQHAYEVERRKFVEAVEYLGNRGYNMHNFAYSHSLAGARVVPGDMSRGRLSQALASTTRAGESVRDDAPAPR